MNDEQYDPFILGVTPKEYDRLDEKRPELTVDARQTLMNGESRDERGAIIFFKYDDNNRAVYFTTKSEEVNTTEKRIDDLSGLTFQKPMLKALKQRLEEKLKEIRSSQL